MTESYVATPPSGKGDGVLVLHAWWGLTDFIRSFCDRLAAEGFVALAPDLFSGDLARTVEEAQAHQSNFDEEHLVPPIVLGAVNELRENSAIKSERIGVVGFSMGAYWALWLAQQPSVIIRAVTLFYGTNGGGGDFSRSKAAFLGNFAENDPYESAATVAALEKNLKGAGRLVDFRTFPGTGHWFFESDRPDAYNEPAARLAWERTRDFLKKELA